MHVWARAQVFFFVCFFFSFLRDSWSNQHTLWGPLFVMWHWQMGDTQSCLWSKEDVRERSEMEERIKGVRGERREKFEGKTGGGMSCNQHGNKGKLVCFFLYQCISIWGVTSSAHFTLTQGKQTQNRLTDKKQIYQYLIILIRHDIFRKEKWRIKTPQRHESKFLWWNGRLSGDARVCCRFYPNEPRTHRHPTGNWLWLLNLVNSALRLFFFTTFILQAAYMKYEQHIHGIWGFFLLRECDKSNKAKRHTTLNILCSSQPVTNTCPFLNVSNDLPSAYTV